MLIPHNPQFKFQMCLLEDLVPQDHLLWLVNRYIDFDFIKELTYPLYCHDKGRPAIDPIVLFKMLFVGYIYGIRRERRLVEEFNVNLAYRWFIGYDLDDPIPNHQRLVKIDVDDLISIRSWNNRSLTVLLSKQSNTV